MFLHVKCKRIVINYFLLEIIIIGDSMFDAHYDMLSYILIKKNDVKFLKKYSREVFNRNNIIGGIFNLFYMNVSEMKKGVGISKSEINVIENFKFVKGFIESNKLFSKDIKFLYAIEGVDYLDDLSEIDELYSLGLRAVGLVWNNESKFGGGIRGSESAGLTSLGKKLVHKLVSLGILIDLSHANEKTFFEVISECKKLKREGYSPFVFASHSNIRTLCNIDRNLTDKMALSIKKLGGVVGVCSVKDFCVNIKDINNKYIDYEQFYIEHIKYLKNLFGGVDNIVISTDDMKYYLDKPKYYKNANIYKHSEVKKRMYNTLLKNGFKKGEIDKLLYKNFIDKILKRVS